MTAPTSPAGSLRIAHLADTHLGYRAQGGADPVSGRNQRAVDVERAFEATIDQILAERVDLVVHAGDVFHHTRPSWSALRCFVRQMRRIEAAGLPCVVIGGNHDTPRLRVTGSVFGLLELALPDIRFVAAYDVVEIPFDRLGLLVHAVPHGALTNPSPAVALPQVGRRNLLVTHGLAPGVKLRGQHEPGEETLSGALLDSGFDYVALGHYHVTGDQGHNAWYSGSTERMGWGDEGVTPGFLIVDLGDPAAVPAPIHRPVPARPMHTLRPIEGEDRGARELADVVLDRLGVFGDPTAMIRVELRNTPRPVRREVEALLRREAADLAWSLQVYSPADVLAGFARGGGDPALPDLRTLFAAFVAEQTTQGVYDAPFVAAFAARGDRALADALHAAEAIAAEDPGG